MSQARWKGKFVKSKVRDVQLKRAANAKDLAKNRKEIKTLLEPDQNKDFVVKGSRLVNLEYMAQNMYCKECHEPLLIQSIERETISGLGSYFQVRCSKCMFMNIIKSSEEYINPSTGEKVFALTTKAVLGAIRSGNGATHLDKIFTSVELPNFTSQVFKNHERIIGPVIEYVAKESCSEAAALERFLTQESAEELKQLLPPHLQDGFLIINSDASSSKDNKPIVRIFASYDMGWSQRGNGYTYDSLNGYCAIIGLKTGKVLDYCTRNRKCKMCDVERRSGSKKEHDCRMNFRGSAKAMEADGAAELVLNSNILKAANVQVGVFIGDNDSSSIAAIQKSSEHEIVKQSDMNHSTKGVGNLLYQFQKDHKKDPDRELSNDVIKHIQRCFTYAVHQNKGDASQIAAAFRCIPQHLSDIHDNCGAWCNPESITGVRLKNENLFGALLELFSDLAKNAYKFSSAASSQANESLNHSMASKAPKGTSYSTSESADFRFASAVAEKNTGLNYLKRCYEVLNMPYHENQLNHIIANHNKHHLTVREKMNDPDFKRKRLELKAKRSQLRHRREKMEGDTYKSNMTLIDQPTAVNEVCIMMSDSPINKKFESHHLAIVFFDLETSGLNSNSEILQVAMKCQEYGLNISITPSKSINPSATKVNGFSKVNKTLFQNGIEVPTVSIQFAFKKVLEYLAIFNKNCVLVAHNCNFDSRHFVANIKKLDLIDEFQRLIYGFADTLPLYRKKFPHRNNGYKLTVLTSELLELPCDAAHDALFDIKLLESLCVTHFDANELTENVKSIRDVSLTLESIENNNRLLPSYAPMKEVLSTALQKRLISHNITYEMIVSTFKTRGLNEAKLLLQKVVDGKPTVIKSKKVLNNIIQYLIQLP